MRSRGKIDAECAQEYLQAHEFQNTLKRICSGKGPLEDLAGEAAVLGEAGRHAGGRSGRGSGAPSTFYVSLTIPSLEGGSPHDLSINLAFETFGLEPVHLVIREPGAKGPALRMPPVQQALLVLRQRQVCGLTLLLRPDVRSSGCQIAEANGSFKEALLALRFHVGEDGRRLLTSLCVHRLGRVEA